MRVLLTIVLAMFLITAVLLGGHHTQITDSKYDVAFHIVHERDGDEWSSLKRAGVRYRTTDEAVVAQLEKVLETRKKAPGKSTDQQMYAEIEQIFVKATREKKATRT